MRFHEAGIIIWCENNPDDLDYLRAISETVYRSYTGEAKKWELPASEPLWKIAFGDRAGILGAELNGRVCCVKLFYDKRIRAKVRTLSGFSKGRRAYRNGRRLNQLGIGSPQMWGYIERRPTGPSLIVTELIDDGMRLDHWVIENGTPRPVVLELARFIRNMHDRGVTHTDLSPRNILIRQGQEHFEFLLLDYEDVRFSRVLPRRTRLKNLHHLHERLARHVSVRDRLRFLHEYAPQDYRVWRTELAWRIGRSQSRHMREPHRG